MATPVASVNGLRTERKANSSDLGSVPPLHTATMLTEPPMFPPAAVAAADCAAAVAAALGDAPPAVDGAGAVVAPLLHAAASNPTIAANVAPRRVPWNVLFCTS